MAWVKPQAEAWAHGVRVLAKISRWHPQLAYTGLGMSLKPEWQYMQRTFPGVTTLMGPIEEALREKFFPSLFGGEKITADFRKILDHSINHGGLGTPDPHLVAESYYNTSKTVFSWPPTCSYRLNISESSAILSKSNWKEGRSLTYRDVKKKQRSKSGGRAGQIRKVNKRERTAPFFHFFM